MTFQTGISGNPTGRPKGSGNRQRLFNSLVVPYQEKLINTALNCNLLLFIPKPIINHNLILTLT